MAISLVAVGQKITAAIMNSVIGQANATGLSLIAPASVAGTGVSMSALGKVSLAAATSASLNGVFTSSAYTNYRILMSLTQATAANVTMVLRASGADSTAANYDAQYLSGSGTSALAGQALAGTSWGVAATGSVPNHSITIELFGPGLASPCAGVVTAFSWPNPLTTSGKMQQTGIMNRLATAFDGFTIASANPMTGTIEVFGYNAG